MGLGMYTHPADRIMQAARPLILILAIPALPVMLFSYGWMLKELVTAAPIWVSAAVVISHLIGWLGIAALFDKREEQRQSSAPER